MKALFPGYPVSLIRGGAGFLIVIVVICGQELPEAPLLPPRPAGTVRHSASGLREMSVSFSIGGETEITSECVSYLYRAFGELPGVRIVQQDAEIEIGIVFLLSRRTNILVASVIAKSPIRRALAAQLANNAKDQDFLQLFSIEMEHTVYTHSGSDIEGLAKRIAADFHGSIIVKR